MYHKSTEKRTKKLRRSRGSRVKVKDHCDLMVPLPKAAGGVSSLECKLLVKEIRNRLSSTGFTHMALTHIIYGQPKPEDRAVAAIPGYLWTPSLELESTDKKRKKPKLNPRDKKAIRILRRLHAVLENQSDMGFYLSNGSQDDLLNEYDLVSICPMNDATFQSTCKSATMADIITLDYTTRGLRLPYRIRSVDIKAAIERGATFEIPIAQALINLKQRKALVHACQELQNNCLGLKPRIILSSGDRTLDGADIGALALRMPGDISNLCKTILRFDDTTASHALSVNALQALNRARGRRFGQRGIVRTVSMIGKADLESFRHSSQGEKPSIEMKPLSEDDPELREDVGDCKDNDLNACDGFIAL